MNDSLNGSVFYSLNELEVTGDFQPVHVISSESTSDEGLIQPRLHFRLDREVLGQGAVELGLG